MSKIEVSFENEILRIEKKTSRKDERNIENIQINTLEFGKEYISKITATNSKEKNKIFLIHELTTQSLDIKEDEDSLQDGEEEIKKECDKQHEPDIIMVYSNKGIIKYSYCNLSKICKKIIKLKYKVISISLKKRKLKIRVLAYLINGYKQNIEKVKFYVDEILNQECKLKQYPCEISKFKMLKDRNIYTFEFDINDILNDDSIINGPIRFSLNINGKDQEIDYRIGKISRKIKNPKYYSIPLKAIYVKDFAIHIRRTVSGNLVLVKRKIDLIEKTLKFKIMESKTISFIMYNLGKIMTKFRRKKINLFYEKFASKSEEGVYDLCNMCQENTKTKNYFVIDKNSRDYKDIKGNKNVITKYSLKFYWLFYNTSYFIASEVPSHLNILRSNNKWFRKAIYDKKFVFLQHGIIFMKNLGLNSVFMKGKEGEAQYMIVSSEKEKDVVVDMLKYDEEQLLNTGLGMYSKIKYNHINNKSKDIITIMLTWKNYEEQLYDFKESSYYKYVSMIYDVLIKYVNKKNIIIIPHPKVQELLDNNSIKDCSWKDSICKESISSALEKTKLLITDYSSVCYNSFYQGAGVVFYQEDLEKYEYENGKLIPNEDEYIGKRAFNIEELETIIKEAIEGAKINLSKVRNKIHEENYKTINEFTDGKNIERIYKKLVELKIV